MLGVVFPLALVVGLSPLPILPVLLLLTTPRGRANGGAYLGAWLVTLAVVVTAALVLGQLSDPEPASEEGIGWVQVVTGAIFLVMAAVKVMRRPRAGEPKETPRWMAAAADYTPRQSARLGSILAGANPKNLAMAIAAGAEIAVLATGPAQTLVGLVGFVLVGSIGVASPVLMQAALGERAAAPLERGRAWLVRHSTVLSVGVLGVLGVALLLKGLSIV